MLAYLFVLIAVAVRLMAGTGEFATYGFTPVGAALLFFGSRMPRKQFWIPVALLIGTDFYLNFKVYGMPITWDQSVVWAWYVAACFIGGLLRGRAKPRFVLSAALASAVSFFLVSNFSVWVAGSVGYPKTFAGLMACYAAGIPFFQKGLASDVLFSAMFFSVPVLISLTRRVMAEKAGKDMAA
jgi:hypothetical protein